MDRVTLQSVGWRNGLISLLLGAGYFLLLAPLRIPARYSFSSDNRYYISSARSLINDGDWALDEYATTAADYRLKQGKEQRWMNFYPPGTSLLALPIVFACEKLTAAQVDPIKLEAHISSLTAKLFSTLTIGLFYLVAVLLTRRKHLAFLLTCIYALSTPQLSTHGGALWSHNATSLLTVAGLFLWLWRGGKWAAWSASPFAFGFCCRPTMLVPAVICGLFLLWQDPKKAGLFLALAALPLISLAALSLHLLGTPLPPYYSFHAGVQQNNLTGYAGTLFSPNRGLFIYCPLLLLAVVGALVGRKPFYLMAAIIAVLEWIMASRNPLWWGGHCYGPRLLVELLPWSMLLLVPAWDFLIARRQHVALTAFLVLTCGWGAFVQWQGVFHASVYQWNAVNNVDTHSERLWDWRDWQILSTKDSLSRSSK